MPLICRAFPAAEVDDRVAREQVEVVVGALDEEDAVAALAQPFEHPLFLLGAVPHKAEIAADDQRVALFELFGGPSLEAAEVGVDISRHINHRSFPPWMAVISRPPMARSRSAIRSARVLQPHRQADGLRRDAALGELLVGELAVGGGGRVADEGAGIADIGDVQDEFERVDELRAPLAAPLEPEGEDAARALRQVFPHKRVIGAGLETRIVDERHVGVAFEVFGDREGALGDVPHAQREGLGCPA